MALPKEPRQKMINLMYLVLTALLALNVSAEILNAFKTVERSLTTTNNTINASTSTIMESFVELKSDPKTAAKANDWEPKALKAQALTKDLNNYLESLKSKIMLEAGFDPAKNGDSTFKEDNQEVATRIMVEEGKGKELRDRLEAYKTAIASIEGKSPNPDNKVVKEIEIYLKQIDLNVPPTKNKGNKTWESVYFYMVPTVAATTMLTKFQNDLRTTENRVIALYHQQVGQVKVRFNQFATIKGQSSSYLMPGQELAITAGVGAFSSDAAPVITIGGKVIPVNEKGIAEFKTAVNAIGSGSIPVHYEWTDQEGQRKTFDDKITYEVGQSNAAISLPEMNVLYIGYPNKIVVSSSGVGTEKIRISVSGGGASATGSGGNYTVNVSQQTDDCVITASTTDGKNLGALKFRVRNMPPPAATVGGKKSGDFVSAAAMAAQAGVGAGIENFPLQLKYSVTRFNVVGVDEDGNVIKKACNGNAFTNDARSMIRTMRSGDILTIEDIYCTGPDGRNTKLPSLLYNIN